MVLKNPLSLHRQTIRNTKIGIQFHVKKEIVGTNRM